MNRRHSIPAALMVLLAALLTGWVLPTKADVPFRQHRYDALSVLPADDDDILFIGNSITNMHEWWEAFGNPHVKNRGNSGGLSQEIIDNLGSLVQGSPRKVFLMIGTNDIGSGYSNALVIGNTTTIVERIHAMSPRTEIYVESILPSTSRPAASVMAVNDAVKAFCEASGYATYVDLWSQIIQKGTTNINGSYTLDGLHLKVSGYKVWCNYISDLVGSACTYPEGQKDNVGSLGGSYGMRESAFGQSKISSGDIVFIGDEVVHGGEWHELLNSDKVKSRGTGWGFPGPTISQVATQLKSIFKGRSDNEEPATVVLWAGAADCHSGTAVNTMEASYKNLIKNVRTYAPNAHLVVMSVAPHGVNTINDNYVKPFNGRLEALAAATENCEYLDVYTALSQGYADYMNGNYVHGLGYVRVANELAPVLGLQAVSMAEAGRLHERGQLRTKLSASLASACEAAADQEAASTHAEAIATLKSAIEAAQTVLSADDATNDDYNAVLKALRTALGALTDIDPAGYLLNMSTGDFTAGSGSFRSRWETTTARPHISFYCGPNNMNTTNGNINIFSGTAGSSVYTLQVSDGYLIDRFELDATLASDNATITTGGKTYTLKVGQAVHISVSDVGIGATELTLAGANKQVALTNFRVFLKADDGAPAQLFKTTTIADGQFADDTEWYVMTIAAAKFLLHDNEGASYISLSAPYGSSTLLTDADLWCFTGDNEEGFRIRNRQAGATKVLAAPTQMRGATGAESYPILVDESAIPSGYTADWQFENTTVLGATRAYYMYEKGYPSNKVNNRNNVFAFWNAGADAGSAITVTLASEHEYVEAEPQTELFITTGSPNYRIPAIATTRKGTVVAVADYRYGGSDIGYGSVELRRRVSYDNGKTWGDILELTHGQYATSPKPKYDAAYGDPCIVADRTSDSILLMSCSGNTGFPDGSRKVHQGIARFYSTDEGESWSEPSYIQDEVYALFDNSSRGPIRSMFIGSGKIHQSRYTKVGEHYRLYCAALVKDVDGTNCNYVLYSDDFGGTWSVLGDVNTPPIPSGADEPKAEELPDGSVVCSSRMNGGRYYNIFTFTNADKAEGSWSAVATSNASNGGVVARDNSCNGEILIVPATRKADGRIVFMALQSVPFGSGRTNVGIYYKELADDSDFSSPAAFAKQWDGSHQSSSLGSAYSTMVMQADGTLAFLYEESTHGSDYTIIYKNYSLEDITDGAYSFAPDADRFQFISGYIDGKMDSFYKSSGRIAGLPDPERRGEVDAAVEAFKQNPCEETYNNIFATLKATAIPLIPEDCWYAIRNHGRGRYYMKYLSAKLAANGTLISSSATQHFRFLPVEGADGQYYIQGAQAMRYLSPTSSEGKQVTFTGNLDDAGIYTLESDEWGRTILVCQNGTTASTALYLNATCDKVVSGTASDAAMWYVEETDYVPSAISNPQADDEDENAGGIFDLQGRRISDDAHHHGISIRNGKKVWFK